MRTESPSIEEAILLKFINETPNMLSLLYDLDLLPEQLKRDSEKWVLMLDLTECLYRITTAP